MIIERGEGDILKVLKSVLDFKVGEGSGIVDASRGVSRIRKILENDANTNSRATMGALCSIPGSGRASWLTF